jgi:hypothetical protein
MMLLGGPAFDVEAADVLTAAHRHQPVGVGIVFLVVGVLQLKLVRQKGRLDGVGQRRRGEFFGASRGIDPRQKGQVGVGQSAKCQAGIGGAHPARRGDSRRYAVHRSDHVRGGKTPCSAMQKFSVR